MVEIVGYNLWDIPSVNLEIIRLKDSIDLLRQDLYSSQHKKNGISRNCLVLKLALLAIILVVTTAILVLALEGRFSQARQESICEPILDPYEQM